MQNFVHDSWIIRRLPALTTGAGFTATWLRSHGYAQTSDPCEVPELVQSI